ncbi:fructosamine kinase [Aureibaculum marinum]|uniref:Fructosamine kinase n=1 Tax=Aureibaculum marinum TaxID=2487930 RepID=A0A3N4P7Y5_9FLAO|nr:fructosamine kinase family protein [Aureibaculum marinum]RPE00781.1 fructosamine kinase [Aureibaculum marinum]
MKVFLNFLSEKLQTSILNYSSVSGGDISQAYVIHSEKQDYFLKTNTNTEAFLMFKKEKIGLTELANTQTIKTPKPIDCGKFEQFAYLLMEYIPTKQPSHNDFEKLGTQLAKLHSIISNKYGYATDNYIGSLPQPNKKHNHWATFYTTQRLYTQFDLALEKNLLKPDEVPTKEHLINIINTFCKKAQPTLLHGDLWSGNFLISTGGEPYLIDPAIYYGHNEVDIAMTQLFGGFPPSFYKAYHAILPKSENYKDCIQLYQLYYLLVHLNLFGNSYYPSVKSILKNYF